MSFNLNWIYIAISWVLLKWHSLWGALLGADNGIAWVLSIVFLVITVRVILFPVFMKQIKSQRAMQALQPQVKELQKKHKGDRETLQREMMELYRREKANPLMGCLPLLLQIPVFLGLFHVLKGINPLDAVSKNAAINEYGWTLDQFNGASHAKLLGAPIAAAFNDPAAKVLSLGGEALTVKIVAAVLIAIMVATTYITQRQMIARTAAAADPQQAMIQKLMLYGIPLSLLVSGSLFPLGVVIYWVTQNLFSMGQQFYVLHKHPPVGANAKAGEKADPDKPSVGQTLAPKPGAKPVNPKKGGPRPATTTSLSKESDEPATAVSKNGTGKTGAAKTGVAKTGAAKSTAAKSARTTTGKSSNLSARRASIKQQPAAGAAKKNPQGARANGTSTAKKNGRPVDSPDASRK
ncbi:membrane protein insertase YidC [Fodinicola feengrottensis]|uniref:Membrane protein insertase YidC n=1 Tax=Fodinicola feengrottensis TaxID=435914 RepID=A0ABN2GW81_9ACTN|nr:membrane protein insertase YidC [Fodinicola feengrottensis]